METHHIRQIKNRKDSYVSKNKKYTKNSYVSNLIIYYTVRGYMIHSIGPILQALY